MNKLSLEYIIKILSLPKIGRKTLLKLINEITFKVSDDKDLMEFINEYGNKFRLPVYSKDEFKKAFLVAEDILISSDKLGISIISFQDEKYPNLLKQISDFPIVLNYIGNLNTLTFMPTVAIIGTREATDFGKKIGIRLGEFFASHGFNIVSGLAIGCDTAGHRGALNVNGITTAVLAHGLDKVYPKENKFLANDIIDKGGLLISEYFVKQSPLANFFVERDRIQAGLSLGVIVIETDVRGGSMHTVRFCLEYNRILASVNHPPEYLHEPKTKGNQLLINERNASPIYNKNEVEKLLNDLMYAYNKSTKEINIPLNQKNSTIDEKVKVKTAMDNNISIQTKLWD